MLHVASVRGVVRGCARVTYDITILPILGRWCRILRPLKCDWHTATGKLQAGGVKYQCHRPRHAAHNAGLVGNGWKPDLDVTGTCHWVRPPSSRAHLQGTRRFDLTGKRSSCAWALRGHCKPLTARYLAPNLRVIQNIARYPIWAKRGADRSVARVPMWADQGRRWGTLRVAAADIRRSNSSCDRRRSTERRWMAARRQVPSRGAVQAARSMCETVSQRAVDRYESIGEFRRSTLSAAPPMSSLPRKKPG